MARAVSARRHAQAIFQIALEKKELEKWQADLEMIANVLKDPQLITLLENPKLRFSEATCASSIPDCFGKERVREVAS